MFGGSKFVGEGSKFVAAGVVGEGSMFAAVEVVGEGSKSAEVLGEGHSRLVSAREGSMACSSRLPLLLLLP